MHNKDIRETNIHTVAKLLDMTKDGVQKLFEKGMPRLGHGKYNAYECTKWYINKVKSASNGRETKTGRQVELLELQIKEKQIDIEEREGDLLNREETCQFLNEVFVSLRSSILGSIPRIALEVDKDKPEFVQSLVEREFRKMLNDAATKVMELQEAKRVNKKDQKKKKGR